MSAPELNVPSLPRATSEPTENAIDQLKAENSKLFASTSTGLLQGGHAVAGRHESDGLDTAFSQTDLTGQFEKLGFDFSPVESAVRSQPDQRAQLGQSAGVSALATSKLANQAGPKVGQLLPVHERC
jgi:hypothetical protein